MSTLRSASLPLEHAVAELAAFPVASTMALRRVLTELDPRMSTDSAAIWREAERTLISSFPAFSIDEVTWFRDWLWYGNGGKGSLNLAQYLRRLARDTLNVSGNAFMPRLPPWSHRTARATGGAVNGLARRFWRWLSFALPPDLLMAAHPGNDSFASRVEMLHPSVERSLRDRGYVEPHLHVGAAIDFPLLWIAALHSIARAEAGPSAFSSPGADLDEGRDLAGWLLRAAIARYVLACFLAERRSAGSLTLARYLIERVFPRFAAAPKPRPAPGRDAAEEDDFAGLSEDWMLEPLLRSVLADLEQGRWLPGGPGYASLQSLYSTLTHIRLRWPHFPQSLADAYHADPIGAMFPALGPGRRSSEMQFLVESFAYLDDEGASDHFFSRLFWQVVRIRNIFYRHLIQRPMTPGLQWFTRFYARLSPARRPIGPELLMESAAVLCGWGKGLQSLEVRTSPSDTGAQVLEIVDSAYRVLQRLPGAPTSPGDALERRERRGGWLRSLGEGQTPPKLGVVLHFSKDRGGNARQGTPVAHGRDSHADPRFSPNAGYRFASFYKQKRKEALAFAWVLTHHPDRLEMLRGLDVCTDELGVPTWVMAPLCRYVRDTGRIASRTLQARFDRDVPPLRATAHTGEDFVHLLGGLRRVDESLQYLRLVQGDRMGHAVALGVDALRWAASTGGIPLTAEERLFDLAWEWEFYSERQIDVTGGRVHYLTDELARLTEDIFSRQYSVAEVTRFVRWLHDESQLRWAGFPDGPHPLDATPEDRLILEMVGRKLSSSDALHLARRLREEASSRSGSASGAREMLVRYLTDAEVFDRGQQIILVNPASEGTTLAALQAELRRKVAALGVSIEINPSSNLLIGNLGDLEHHPLWRLKPVRPSQEFPPVAVCIGSDDPITFATGTCEEYQLVYDTLTLAGVSDVEARAWLEDARQAGLDWRFTVPPDHEPGHHPPAEDELIAVDPIL